MMEGGGRKRGKLVDDVRIFHDFPPMSAPPTCNGATILPGRKKEGEEGGKRERKERKLARQTKRQKDRQNKKKKGTKRGEGSQVSLPILV